MGPPGLGFKPLPIRRRPNRVATTLLSLSRRSPRPATTAPAEVDRLAARARTGDHDAFHALYDATVGRVYAVCLRLTADPALAEELTQDVFVQVWRRLETFRGESAFTTWLHRLAVNQVCSDRRSESRRQRRAAVAAPARDACHPAPGAALDLDGAIAALPPGARQAFVLHDVEGYTHEEIARMNGRTPGTIKAQLFRARRLLREMLDR